MEVVPENTSGQGRSTVIPPEIKGWNWGAFFFGWIWGISNRVWISLLSAIPYLGIIMLIVLGVKGNEWAWRKKKWDSIEHFKSTQRNWGIAAAVVLATIVIIVVVVIIASSVPPTTSVPQTEPPGAPSTAPLTETSTSPSHGIPLTELRMNTQYWNTEHEKEALRIFENKTWDKADEAWIVDETYELYSTVSSINKEYHRTHTYIEGEFDCNDMAVDVWNMLHKEGIASLIVVGNLDLDNESFAESDHAWLVIPYLYFPNHYSVELTNGEVYLGEDEQYWEGYYYTSPSNLRADIRERW